MLNECFHYNKKMLPVSGIELALSFPPVSAHLIGGGVPVICSAPVSECWPELDVKSQGCPPSSNGSSEVQTWRSPQLRRGGPRRRTGVGALSSGEYPSHRRWGSGNLLCSCERMLAGAGREIAGCPPSSDGSSEVQTLRSPQLRRGKPHRGWTRSKYPALHEPSAAKQKPPLARA